MPTEDFKRIFESLRVPVAITDPKGAIASANSAFVELAAQDARTLHGVELASLFSADDRKRLQQNLSRVGEGKAASALLDAQLSPHGTIKRWVSVALQPVRDARDKAVGAIAIVQDIGTQRETDEALNLVTARLLGMAEASPVASMIETAVGDIELVNEAFCELLALESAPQSLSGLPVHEVLARSPRVDAAALEKIRKKPTLAGSVALQLEDGRSITLERTPLVVEGEFAGAVWTPREQSSPAQTAEKGAAEIALIE
ncbi:MAG: PAS domain-containing protein, partial [Usitatibacter sp.]